MLRKLFLPVLFLLPGFLMAQEAPSVEPFRSMPMCFWKILPSTLISGAPIPAPVFRWKLFGNPYHSHIRALRRPVRYVPPTPTSETLTLPTPIAALDAGSSKPSDKFTAEVGYLYDQVGSGIISSCLIEQRPLLLTTSLLGASPKRSMISFHFVGGQQRNAFDIIPAASKAS